MSFAQLKLKPCFLISKAIILRGFNDASLISRMYNPKVELMEPEHDGFQVPTFHGLICRFQPNDVGEGRLKCQHFVLPGHFIICYLIILIEKMCEHIVLKEINQNIFDCLSSARASVGLFAVGVAKEEVHHESSWHYDSSHLAIDAIGWRF